jgi:hypothetical protein
MIRSDFDEIYDRLGPEGLTAALRARLGPTERLDREMRRMQQTGKWVVAWDDETGDPRIVGRKPQD